MNDEQFVNDIIDRLTEEMKVDREVFYITKNGHAKFRSAVHYILRYRTFWSLEKIGGSIEGNTVDHSTVVHNIKGVGNLMIMHWKGFHDPYCQSIDNVLKLTTNILKYDSRKWKKYKQLHGV
jgi:chromosomal replication initiation ATPase DnaA